MQLKIVHPHLVGEEQVARPLTLVNNDDHTKLPQQRQHITNTRRSLGLKVTLCLCLTKHYAMKTYGGMDVEIHVFFTLILVLGVSSASRHGRFSTAGKMPRYPRERKLCGL
jgi:hypothetical protein